MAGHAKALGRLQFVFWAVLSTACNALDDGGETRPVEPLPADAGTVVASAPEANAGAAAESTVPPSVPAAGSAAPSSTPDAGHAAPSSKPDAGTPPAAGSRSTAPDAGSGALTEGENTGTGKGGVSQSDGKLAAFIELNDVPSGAEAHRCVLVELPNTEPVWVSALHASLGNGSHHMIVDRPGEEVALIPNAELCSPTMGGDVSRLMIAQQHETRLDLPDGVGFLLEPKQRIFLQLHYVNTTTKSFAIKGTIELELFPKDVRPIEAKSVFTGSTSITLPPRQPGESKHFQVLPADPAWNVFAMTSHTHQLGVHATIERVASATAPTIAPLHESRDWSEPPLTVFQEPLVFDGTDGLRLTCRYMNTTDRDVHFGTGVDDEMCFMWVYYFENGQR